MHKQMSTKLKTQKFPKKGDCAFTIEQAMRYGDKSKLNFLPEKDLTSNCIQHAIRGEGLRSPRSAHGLRSLRTLHSQHILYVHSLHPQHPLQPEQPDQSTQPTRATLPAWPLCCTARAVQPIQARPQLFCHRANHRVLIAFSSYSHLVLSLLPLKTRPVARQPTAGWRAREAMFSEVATLGATR